jgi:hypothetical protein
VRMSNLIARYKRPVRRCLFRFSRVEDQFSSLRKVLEENNWFFSSRRYFDDQDDMVMPEVRIRGVPEETLLRARENLQRLWNDMGVLCFSEVWNDPRMWSLYADSGNGVCLRLSCASLKAGLAPPDCPLPVLYSDRARAPWRVPEDEREDEEVVCRVASPEKLGLGVSARVAHAQAHRRLQRAPAQRALRTNLRLACDDGS